MKTHVRTPEFCAFVRKEKDLRGRNFSEIARKTGVSVPTVISAYRVGPEKRYLIQTARRKAALMELQATVEKELASL